jgi:chlorophyllide a reductase subunit Y
MAGKARFDEMRAFFEGVGSGHATGVWEDTPQDRPDYREQYQRKLARQAKARKAEEMG